MSLMDFSLGNIGSLFTDIREAWTGEAIVDPNKKAEIDFKMRLLEQEVLKAQMDVNKTEAQHKSIFVAGWRPFIGWAGGVAIAYNYIAQPFIYTMLMANDVNVPMPVLDLGTLMVLVTGMLGFGGLRSFDKKNGVSNGA